MAADEKSSSSKKRNIISVNIENVNDEYYTGKGSDGVKYQIPRDSIDGQARSLDDSTLILLHVPEKGENKDSISIDDGKVITIPSEIEAKWTDAASKFLIERYKHFKPLVDNRKIGSMKSMWFLIKRDMDEAQHFYSVPQIENRWKSLKRAYIKRLSSTKPPKGRGSKCYVFENELAEILTPKNNVTPSSGLEDEQTSDTDMLEEIKIAVTPSSDEHSDASMSDSSDEGDPLEKNKIKNNDLRLLTKALNRLSKEKRRAGDKHYEQRERIIKQMRRQNKLLEQILVNLTKK